DYQVEVVVVEPAAAGFISQLAHVLHFFKHNKDSTISRGRFLSGITGEIPGWPGARRVSMV
ncbi:MAG: hypothetical protein Q7R35_18990, partial [Elusimicrobiota bacterium]|nr:hypothetical protein [Elusimicrobiota bacterium]